MLEDFCLRRGISICRIIEWRRGVWVKNWIFGSTRFFLRQNDGNSRILDCFSIADDRNPRISSLTISYFIVYISYFIFLRDPLIDGSDIFGLLLDELSHSIEWMS